MIFPPNLAFFILVFGNNLNMHTEAKLILIRYVYFFDHKNLKCFKLQLIQFVF